MTIELVHFLVWLNAYTLAIQVELYCW